MTGAAGRSIATCFALAAFSVAVVAGLASGNAAELILLRAILAMVACYPLGLLVGLVCQHVIDQHVQAIAAENEANAVPGQDGDGSASQSAESAKEAEEVIVV